MKLARHVGLFFLGAMGSAALPAQTTTDKTPPTKIASANPWDFNLSLSGYIVPQGQSYASPTLTADHGILHLEARYNYEGQRTGSLWAGYNFSFGKKVTFDITPMLGGVIGEINGIAPGLEATISYKKLQLYSANEYIFNTNSKSDNFFYTWTQLTYSPVSWFGFGYVTQRTRAYRTPLDIQRGPLVEFTHKKISFSAEVFNIGEADPTYVLSLGYTF